MNALDLSKAYSEIIKSTDNFFIPNDYWPRRTAYTRSYKASEIYDTNVPAYVLDNGSYKDEMIEYGKKYNFDVEDTTYELSFNIANFVNKNIKNLKANQHHCVFIN